MNVALIKRSTTLRLDLARCLFILAPGVSRRTRPAAAQPGTREGTAADRQAFNFAGKGQAESRRGPSRAVLRRILAIATSRGTGRIYVVACRNLKMGDELFFDYRLEVEGRRTKSWKETLSAIAEHAVAAGQCWSRWNSDFVARIVSFGGLSGSS